MNKSNDLPLVSVIVPVYNVEKYLQRCLDSVIEQSFKAIEILIINDGSTDNSLNIVQEYKKKDFRIKIINQENKGLGGARNTGIKHSIAEYLVFVDSDDTINSKMIETLYRNAISEKYDIVSCQYYRVNQENNILETSPIDRYSNNPISDYLEAGISVMTWNKLYSKKLFILNNIEFPEKQYYEDQFTTLKLFFYSQKHIHLQKPLYKWFVTNNSISQTISQKHIDDLFQVFETIKQFLIDKKIYIKYQNLFFARVLYITSTHLLNSLLSYNIQTAKYIEEIEIKLKKIYENKQKTFELIKSINYAYYVNYFYTIFKISLINNIEINHYKSFLQKDLIPLEDLKNLDSSILINLIKKQSVNELIIYGTGKIANDILKQLNKDIHVISILDSNPNATIEGFDVFTLDTVTINLNNKYIVIASIAFANQIQNRIQEYAIENNISINTISICDLI